ncbi:MAG: UDP-3-O-acyl-N-acetylglucosamine deacetylase [Pseudomonadota bacterium]
MSRGFTGSKQTTLQSEVILKGIGVHSGAPVSLVIHPADADSGIRFQVTENGRLKADIPADYKSISNVNLCTILSSHKAHVATVEHLLAALHGLSIDNAIVEIEGNEIPIMDGSSAPFVDAIDEVGVTTLQASRRFIKVLKKVQLHDCNSWGEFTPYNGFHLDIEIDFEIDLIGKQRFSIDMNPGAFRRELSRARTFGFMAEVKKHWAAGRALGASLENTIAIGEDRIINPEGLRFKNEFVRHKTLDAVGDLSLAGAPILGAYRSSRGGHRLNSLMLGALFADKEAWTYVEAPRVRETGRAAEIEIGMAAANFAADRS